ncbi:MAG: SDR family NAD(P)-dependent oxidoreductase [Planctomycetota bacterium]|nr:MAG: SDR family NAD(P)-dependent oxidoreductase [Planctomycetota bacterium]
MAKQDRILITGANRGLGLEFTKRWLQAGHQIFALARQPQHAEALQALKSNCGERLWIGACDVSDTRSVEAAAEQVAEKTSALDLVLNNAGTYATKGGSLAELDFQEIRTVFETNSLGPLRVSRSFLPLLRQGNHRRLVHMTSLMGSIADNGSGGSYAYRISKAALNMANCNLAHELKPDGIPSVVLHPGWVRTDMGGPYAPLSIDEAVSGLIKVVESLQPKDSGAFFDYTGRRLPW